MWLIGDLQVTKIAEKFYEAVKEQLAGGKELRPVYALHGGDVASSKYRWSARVFAVDSVRTFWVVSVDMCLVV
jgi:hypothetical protein